MSVFHLKYRPTRLAEMDLPDVSEKIAKIFAGESVPQSFLLSGPKGSGKTSAARIIARIVNCKNRKGVEPCDKCDDCKEILKGSAIDVIEIDAASNRGIEDIRSLKDKVYLLPVKLRRKVFIIDEVHMLTKEAFNALLKLIEEPPAHTFFISCTTDPQKIPDTVLSRLVKIEFRRGKETDLIKSLRRIVKGEGIEVEDEVLHMLVKNSDGSFRNIQRVFNEMVMELGAKLDKKAVEGYLSDNIGEYSEAEFEKDLFDRDVKKIVKRIEKMAESGLDFKQYRERLLRYFHNKFVEIVTTSGGDSGWKWQDIDRFIVLLINQGKLEKDIAIDQLPLELAVIEFALGQEGGGKVASNDKNEPVQEIKDVKKNEESALAPVVDKVDKEELVGVDNTDLLKKIDEEWGNLLKVVKPLNHSVEAFLRAARPRSVKGTTIVCEVYYPFHKDKLEEDRNKRVVEKGLETVFGVRLDFRCQLSRNKKAALIIQNDTPLDQVSSELADESKLNSKPDKKDDIYDVAKEIFG